MQILLMRHPQAKMQNPDIVPPTNALKVDADADAAPRLMELQQSRLRRKRVPIGPQQQFLRKH